MGISSLFELSVGRIELLARRFDLRICAGVGIREVKATLIGHRSSILLKLLNTAFPEWKIFSQLDFSVVRFWKELSRIQRNKNLYIKGVDCRMSTGRAPGIFNVASRLVFVRFWGGAYKTKTQAD